MTRCVIASLVALAMAVTVGAAEESVRRASKSQSQGHHHHHGHHHHKKNHHHNHKDVQQAKDEQQQDHLKNEDHQKAPVAASNLKKGVLEVNGPLPADFNELFSTAVCKAADCDPAEVKVLGSKPVLDAHGVMELIFEAPETVLNNVKNQAADPDSKLTAGALHSFLVAKDDDDGVEAQAQAPEPVARGLTAMYSTRCPEDEPPECPPQQCPTPPPPPPPPPQCPPSPPPPPQCPPPPACPSDDAEDTPYTERGIDIDTAMPYGDLEPFGREDTAQELTEASIRESDEMVDQLERAEVAEEKRATFRALTRLRGAAITSFDGVARSQTGNVDEYNKVHKWRSTHPLHHLADEESDITKWAFPDNADF